MPFTEHGAANLAQGQLLGGVSASSPSGILQSGQGALFPTNAECPFWAKVEKFDTLANGFRVIKREIVKVTGRSGDTLTWTRSAGYCPFDYQATTQTNTAAAFDSGDTVTQILSAEQIREIQDGIQGKVETVAGTRTGFPVNKTIYIDPTTGAEVVRDTSQGSSIGPTELILLRKTTGEENRVPFSILQSSLSSQGLVENVYFAGQAISQGESLFLEQMETFAAATTAENISDVTANTRHEIPMF